MTQSDAKSIFLAAVERSGGEERTAFLDQACAGDALLRHRVEALLIAHDRPDSFLERPAVDPARDAPTQVSLPKTEQPGSVIGPYKLLQEIGEGGMGVVYLAEQTVPVRRKVALKIIKPGMDTRQVIARFEAERQAVAMMEHQNIARVLDAGTTGGASVEGQGGSPTGRPYFVMELVKGIPITDYCDRNKLSTRERLELFNPVCQAIQHAHQKGVIHRDIKPSNVLVCLYDGKPVPKVIDFGVAKAIERPLTEKTMFTEHGQVVGTLEYMSPEQAELNQLDIDTRSDIYSLGVMLYELLTGSTPIPKGKLREAAFVEILRTICEDEPEPPSTRLSRSGDAMPTISAQRKTEPKKLSSLIRGELDWIVMKTLEKDRTRRYETAAAMAADIERHLNNEPVAACPPSVVYKFRKFAYKHRAAVATTATIGILLIVGATLSAWQAVRATRAERDTRRALLSEAEAREAADRDRQRALNAERQARAERDVARRAGVQEANAREQAESAGRETQAVLGRSLYEQARTLRLAGEFGRRWKGLDLLERSEQLRGRIGEEYRDEMPTRTQLRSEALSALLQRDARVVDEWPCMFAAMSPDGKVGATSWLDFTQRTTHTRLIDLSTGTLLRPAEDSLVVPLHAQIVGMGPGGKLLVCQISGRQARSRRFAIVDSTTGEPIRSLKHPVSVADTPDPVFHLQNATFSPDGNYLAAIDFSPGNTRVLVWDLSSDREEGDVIATVVRPPGPTLAFRSDSRILAFASGDATVVLWNIAEGQIEREIALEQPTTGSLGFTPDGKQLAVMCTTERPQLTECMLVFCNVDSGREDSQMTVGTVVSTSNVAFSPDGRRVALADLSGTLHVFDRRERSAVVVNHGSMVRQLSWDSTGRHLISASQAAFKIWEFAENLPLASRDLPTKVGRFAFSPNGRWFAMQTTAAGEFGLFDRGSHQQVRAFEKTEGYSGGIRSLCFSPDNKIVVCLTSRAIIVWDVETGQRRGYRAIDELQAREIGSVGFGADAKVVVAGATGNLPTVWDVATGEVHWQSDKHEHCQASISFDAGRVVVSQSYAAPGEEKETMSVMDLDAGRELYRMEHPPRPLLLTRHVDWSRDGRWIATFEAGAFGPQVPTSTAPTSGTWAFGVRDAATGQSHLEFQLTANLVSYAFSPDGRFLAVATRDGNVQVWDVDHREHVLDWNAWPVSSGQDVESRFAVIRHLDFTPDGQSLAILDTAHHRLRYLDLAQANQQLSALGLGW